MTLFTSARISIPLDIPKVDVIETKHTHDGQFLITVESQAETTICGVCKKTIRATMVMDKRYGYAICRY